MQNNNYIILFFMLLHNSFLNYTAFKQNIPHNISMLKTYILITITIHLARLNIESKKDTV